MAKVSKVRRKSASRRNKSTPYSSPPSPKKLMKSVCKKKHCILSDNKKDWEDSTCSVCMEFPHNAVLLLCSSYEKGCRPYMCATSHRYSNCLDQYKKTYTNVISAENEKKEIIELLCPLCRGQVKGWTVVDPARQYLNAKKRTCMQENCSFVGSYKQLRKHVKAEHPLAQPREVDPTLKEKWARIEHEREVNDVMSSILSSMPGSIVLGDYVIEGRYRGFEEYLSDVFLPMASYGGGPHLHQTDGTDDDDDDDNVDDLFRFAYANSRSRRLVYGRSWRRRMHGLASGDR